MSKYAKQIEELLQRTHLFKSLDESGRKQMAELAEVVRRDSGAVLMEEGSDGDCFYLLLKGQVTVSAQKNGDSVELAKLGPGAVVGEVALLTGEPRTATVTTEEPAVLVRFIEPGINDLLDHYPKVKELLVRVLVHRAKDTVEKLLNDKTVS